jgi:uncharacterized membrane protein
VSAIAAGFFAFGEIASPLRPVIALWFLSLCPGMAFVRFLDLGEQLPELIVAIALSLALDSIVAGLMVYTGTWSPRMGLAVLIALSVVGALLQLQRDRAKHER